VLGPLSPSARLTGYQRYRDAFARGRRLARIRSRHRPAFCAGCSKPASLRRDFRRSPPQGKALPRSSGFFAAFVWRLVPCQADRIVTSDGKGEPSTGLSAPLSLIWKTAMRSLPAFTAKRRVCCGLVMISWSESRGPRLSPLYSCASGKKRRVRIGFRLQSLPRLNA